MIALIRGLISIIITVAAILFALANRQSVNLAWSPLNDPVALPLCVVGLGALGIGFVAGALVMWLRSIGWKFQIKRQKRQIDALEKNLHAVPVQSPILQGAMPERHLLLQDREAS
jgi:uncharacterized integral membrane protein